MSTPLDAFNSRATSAYIARLATVRLKNSSSRSASANGASIPAAACEASPPTRPRSTTTTRTPACPSRQAIAHPITPAPIFAHAARVFEMAVGRVDLVVNHGINRALDPVERALLEVSQVIGRVFG